MQGRSLSAIESFDVVRQVNYASLITRLMTSDEDLMILA